jgi:5-methylcytosine-specific restriction endonuclease McrA
MTRNGLPNYRKLALNAYVPICVYCGFGIKEILEVAHLDCNPENNDLANLVLLCPTCHRMHDVDLIPTDVVIRLRDEKRTVKWAKLTKDAALKAVATKRNTPDLLAEAGRKAAAMYVRICSDVANSIVSAE